MAIAVCFGFAHLAAVAPAHANHNHVTRMRSFDGRQDVGGITAGGDRNQHVAGLSQGTHLAGKKRIKRIVVAHRSEDGCVGGQGDGGKFRALAVTSKTRSPLLPEIGRAHV